MEKSGPSPADLAGTHPPTRSCLDDSLEHIVRLSLSRLDPRYATPEQVRDALDAAGVHVPLVWASEWLDGRRGHGRG